MVFYQPGLRNLFHLERFARSNTFVLPNILMVFIRFADETKLWRVDSWTYYIQTFNAESADNTAKGEQTSHWCVKMWTGTLDKQWTGAIDLLDMDQKGSGETRTRCCRPLVDAIITKGARQKAKMATDKWLKSRLQTEQKRWVTFVDYGHLWNAWRGFLRQITR